MKPPPFDYAAPESLEEVLDLLAEHGPEAKLLAGGQSLIPVLNFRLAQPALLVDLNGLAELAFIDPGEDGALRIGALTRQRALERDAEVARHAPLLAEAVPWIAHPQIRNRGTVGGSLAHADPAAELPAVAVALEARFRLVSRDGERWVEAADYYRGLFDTALAPGEVLAEVHIAPCPPRTGWAFLEQARRRGDYAQVGLAAGLHLDEDGSCRQARLVFLSVGNRPLVASRAAAVLEGQRPGEEGFDEALAEAAEIAAGEIEPVDDVHASADFKRHLAGVLTRRAVHRAAERAMAPTPEAGGGR